MKKVFVFASLAVVALTISYCSASKKAAKKPVKLNYQTNIQNLVVSYCSPCHIPAKGGRRPALDTYASATKNIDDMLRRIQLNPTDRGFMPDKGKKLSDSVIRQFVQWKTDGLLEKAQ